MIESNNRFGPALLSLWLRLNVVAAVGLLFVAVAALPQMISNWRLYETTGETLFGVVVRIVFVTLAAVVLGTVATLVSAPFLLRRGSRQRIARIITSVAVAIAVYFDFSVVATMVMTPLVRLSGLTWFPTRIIYSAAFAAAMFIPRRRKQIVTSLDGFLEEKMTRRAALAMGVAAGGIVTGEWLMGRAFAPNIVSASSTRRRRPNILLVTFDALSAEDMSLYGYRLPTTPNISRFADRSYVFTNFYSASTFTTSSLASVLTGVYPSDHRVYDVYGRLGPDYSGRTLAHLMRSGGYSTGFVNSNPFGYFLVEALDFDIRPDHPAYRTDGFDLWGMTKPLHQRQPYGSRTREFADLENLRDYRPTAFGLNQHLFLRTESGFAPGDTFAQGREVLDRLGDGFFMWVHVLAPHGPYLPDAPWMGRFLPRGEMMSGEAQWAPTSYDPAQQAKVDKARLRYDEFIAEADSAFGAFLSGLESAGKLQDTAVIVSADHGESFVGGIYSHMSRHQTRPQLHIPLIIHRPGQEQGKRVGVTADLTDLAPTVLEIAGLPQAEGMRGQSLVPWMNSDNGGEGQGLAFAQFFSGNRIFEPVKKGTVGVIDARNQYVVDIETGKGILRSLDEAHLRDRDHSAEYPDLARQMRRTIHSRFPGLPRIQA